MAKTTKKTKAVKKKATKKKVAKKKPAAKKKAAKKVAAPKPTLYVTYAAENELRIYNTPGGKAVNRVLMATYLSVKGSKDVDGKTWLQVSTYGEDGWVEESKTTKARHLKIFFVDVGQGDGALMEVGDKRFLFDAGPRKDANVERYLNWQYGPLIKAKSKVHIDYLFLSHFDEDHYGGIINVINNPNFTFDTIYVAGIGKFKEGKRETTLGDKTGNLLTTYFDDLNDLQVEYKTDGQPLFITFIKSVEKAVKEGRLRNGIKRLFVDNPAQAKYVFPANTSINNLPFNIQVLGPVFKQQGNAMGFEYLKDESHTVNGHSLVLKVNYGTRTFLLGGDLNTQAENELLKFYQSQPGIFDVDLAKSCHHGSSDFTEKFMAAINPHATVISSGDNEKHAHPRADAIGCAGKYSKNVRPLVFSTELARSVDFKAQTIQYGMVNVRCNGTDIYLAQKKEAKSPTDMWDSYGPL